VFLRELNPFNSPEVHNKTGIIAEHGDGYVIAVQFTDWTDGVPCELRARVRCYRFI